MIKVATAAQMRECDRVTIEELGLPGLVLMENASRAVASQAVKYFEGSVQDQEVHVFCGRGNNGGDGFAVARHLQNMGAEVTVYLLGAKKSLTGDARFNCDLFEKIQGRVEEISTPEDLPEADELTDLIIDALLGTGFQGEVRNLFATAIDLMNDSAAPIIAIDIPSGVNSDSGQVSNSTIFADQTVTFGLVKRGLLVSPGREFVGDLIIADIGIPPQVVDQQLIRLSLVEGKDIQPLIPSRSLTAHKGDAGHVYLLAGSPGLTGAAALSAEAAMRTGAGLVAVGVPEGLNRVLEVKLDEAMTQPLAQTATGALSSKALPAILPKLEWADCVVIGPGLGREVETGDLIEQLLSKITKPLVIDADGLNQLAQRRNLLSHLPPDTILTPHPGEFCRLTGLTQEELLVDPFEAAQTFAQKWGVTVVLKGAPTITATASGELYLNPTGNPGMATGGSGDVLTGLIGSLIAQGLPPETAAWMGVYLHGAAGDAAAEEIGIHGLVAGDIIAHLPQVIQDLT